MLDYTLQTLTLDQRAVIVRDKDVVDEFGGEAKQEREPVGKPVPCLSWWWHAGGARSPAREYASPIRTINESGGGMIVARDTDIRAGDFVKEITDAEGEPLISGPFRVIAVEPYPDHIDVALMRP